MSSLEWPLLVDSYHSMTHTSPNSPSQGLAKCAIQPEHYLSVGKACSALIEKMHERSVYPHPSVPAAENTHMQTNAGLL